MTDVFLSYSSKDRGGTDDDGTSREDRVTPIVELLKAQGFDVFWDQTVPAGTNWNNWIRQKLKDAKCALVLWSNHSIESDNVVHEATIAHKHEKLISVLIDPIEADQFPMGLYTHQAVKLIDWSGDDSDEAWRKAVGEVEARLTPHAPLWLQRAIHGLEADLAAERVRVKSAETRAREIERKLGQGAEAVLEAERDRDSALEEAAAAKAKLAASGKTHAEAEARLAALEQSLKDLESERDKALKEAEAERDTLAKNLKETEDALEEARRRPAARLKPKREPVQPGQRGGTLYTVIALVLAVVSFAALTPILALGPEIFRPIIGVRLDDVTTNQVSLAIAVIAYVLALILVIVRRRRLGAAELALYWFVLMAPLAATLCMVTGLLLLNNQWTATGAFLLGFFVSWFLLLRTAKYFSTRREPQLTGPALGIYWFGLCLPFLWFPVANHIYSGLFGLPGFYLTGLGADYSGYVIALVLVAASGLWLIRRWRRRPA